MELKSQVTNKVPIFEVLDKYNEQRNAQIRDWGIHVSIQVSHIDPGTPIKLYLYAENAKGTSDPASIDDASLNQQKHYVEGKDDVEIWDC